MIDPKKLTEKTLEAIGNAADTAKSMSHSETEPLHILDSLTKDSEGIISGVLNTLKINPQEFNSRVKTELRHRPTLSQKPEQVPISRELASILDKSEDFMVRFGDEFISVEHIFLSLEANDRSVVKKVFRQFGLSQDKILAALQKIRGTQRITDQNPETQYEAVDKYGIDYTKLAVSGKLDPVIGRQDEIRRVMKVLSRRRKNNPALIGEPGVGKTAIVEGLAQKIANDDVPEQIRGSRLVQLDMGALIAGTQYRGEFEKRLKSFMDEVTQSNQKIILFIDEMHTIVGAGATGGSMDASNILKPALARGELHMIGATTIDEYRKHIEKDPALERRFATILVDEPSVDETISILRGLREKYELHHSVRITEEAIQSAAKLSSRYIADRFLPDKAIDLIDEAAANLNIDLFSQPEEIDNLEKQVAQLKIEKKGLEREEENKERLDALNEHLRILQDDLLDLKNHWQKEKSVVDDIKEIREKIDEARKEQENAERKSDLETAARIKYGVLTQLKQALVEKEEELREVQKNQKLMKEEVDEEEVCQVLSQWTGIPVSKLTESELSKLLKLEEKLQERVVGQDEAVSSVSNVVRIARASLADPRRPLGSFIFLGSTGVGKTELAKALAETLFDTEEALIRIDMSEYMEKHSVSRLIGAPPGYVGYDEGGQLTEAVRRHPFSVVLFDEIEKAHPEVFNIFLQILDDGQLTDNKGRKVSFKNTILIMTSNLGSRLLLESSKVNTDRHGDVIDEAIKNELKQILETSFPPEFLNRIDEIVIFNPLGKSVVKKIVELQFSRIKKRLSEQSIDAELTESALEFLADIGYDPAFGARPVKRVLQQEVTRELAQAVLTGKLKPGDKAVVDINGERIIIR